MPKHITKEQKENLVRYYLSKPMTVDSVAQYFGISIPSVIKILDQYKIKRYTKVQLFSPELVEDYFSSIDTEKKAYFLGLIITDGCVFRKHSKQAIIAISLQESDKYILEEFKREIRSNKQITHDGRGCCSIQILSNKMADDLKLYGVEENKSLHTKFPDALPDFAYPHLLRGILDGDGSVSFYSRPNRKSHTKAVRFCQGNRDFLVDLVHYLSANAGTSIVSIYQEKETLWSIAYRSNNDLISIIAYLYRDATVYLRRKQQLCEKIVDECIAHNGNTEITNAIKAAFAS